MLVDSTTLKYEENSPFKQLFTHYEDSKENCARERLMKNRTQISTQGFNCIMCIYIYLHL